MIVKKRLIKLAETVDATDTSDFSKVHELEDLKIRISIGGQIDLQKL